MPRASPRRPATPRNDSAGAAATPTARTPLTTDAVSPAATSPAGASGVGASVAAFAGKHRLALSITGGVLALALLGTGAVFAGAAVSGGDDVEAVVATSTPTPTADPARPAPGRRGRGESHPHVFGRRSRGRRATREPAGTGRQRRDRRGALRPRRNDPLAHGQRHEGADLGGRPHGARSRLSRHDDRGEGHRARLRRARRRRRRHALAHAERNGDRVSRRRPPRRARRPGAGRVGCGPRQPAAHQARPRCEPVRRRRVGAELGSGGARVRLHVQHHRPPGRRRPRRPRREHVVAQRRPDRPRRAMRSPPSSAASP